MGDYQREHWDLPQFGEDTILLGEAAGIGTADLSRIDVRGVQVKNAVYDRESRRKLWPAEVN